MWFRLMMLAFVFNGICNFGIRILAGYGLAGQYTSTYFLLWFLGGSSVLGIVLLYRGKPSARVGILTGIALGVASFGGQISLGSALASGLPGALVYPVSLAGGLFVVVAAGVVLFKEYVGPYAIAGIALGIFSIALLSF